MRIYISVVIRPIFFFFRKGISILRMAWENRNETALLVRSVKRIARFLIQVMKWRFIENKTCSILAEPRRVPKQVLLRVGPLDAALLKRWCIFSLMFFKVWQMKQTGGFQGQGTQIGLVGPKSHLLFASRRRWTHSLLLTHQRVLKHVLLRRRFFNVPTSSSAQVPWCFLYSGKPTQWSCGRSEYGLSPTDHAHWLNTLKRLYN